jgi:hypothetical protein
MTGPPKQVLAVLDFLTDLHRIICLHYEHELTRISIDKRRESIPHEHEQYADNDEIPC